ncbi:hypothetical protein ACCS79_03660 [Rhizobium johnstonii]|uniref:hypothetical protein n=1 Tax=Rhizobium johnstonii TaxID=3019933 RepID=UPI003F9BB89A
MTKTFEFDVARVPVAIGEHSYEATDRANAKKIALPKGGTEGIGNLVGAYPEIEEYLRAECGIDTDMAYDGRRDTLSYPSPEHASWTKPRTEDDIIVIVHDINRAVYEISEVG